MTLEQFKDKQSVQTAISDIKRLETENLLKNTFLIELQAKLESCYDNENKIDISKISGLIDFLDKDLYGANQGASELYDITCSVNNVCDLLRRL